MFSIVMVFLTNNLSCFFPVRFPTESRVLIGWRAFRFSPYGPRNRTAPLVEQVLSKQVFSFIITLEWTTKAFTAKVNFIYILRMPHPSLAIYGTSRRLYRNLASMPEVYLVKDCPFNCSLFEMLATFWKKLVFLMRTSSLKTTPIPDYGKARVSNQGADFGF